MGKNRDKKERVKGKLKAAHIFDDVFRTMEEHVPKLMIPLINEVFGTEYPMDAKVVRLGDRHHRFGTSGETDSILCIQDKSYHLECESSETTGVIVIRMVEYDFSMALDTIVQENGTYVMQLPNSGVLYLRHNSHTRDKERIIIRMADGRELEYFVPIIKSQEYSPEEIFKKKLFMLLPFYLLRYEKQLSRLEEDEQERSLFLKEYQEICNRLTQDMRETLDYIELCGLMKRVNDYILREQSQLKKGVQKIMGGQVLEDTPIGMYRKGREEGLVILASLVRDHLLDAKVAAERAGITEEELKQFLHEEQ